MQTSIFGNPNCPFSPLLEHGDNHCFEPLSKDGYETISENHSDFDLRLAEVRGVGLDVNALPVTLPELPSFIPDVGGGNGKIIATTTPDFMATTIARVVSPKTLSVREDIHKVMNVPYETNAVLLGYAEDTLLESIWTNRYAIVPKLAKLSCIITSPDYSVFPNQPHAERLINQKRSLIIFEMLQQLGAKVIPHMHWFAMKDLRRWAVWINQNLAVTMIALDLQMLNSKTFWEEAIRQLIQFVALLNRQIHFIITGPSTPERIQQVMEVFSSVTFTSANPIIAAAKHRKLLPQANGSMSKVESPLSVTSLVKQNVATMEKLTGAGVRADIKLPYIPAASRLGVVA